MNLANVDWVRSNEWIVSAVHLRVSCCLELSENENMIFETTKYEK